MHSIARQKSVFSTSMSLYRMLTTVRPLGVVNSVPSDCGKLVTLTGGDCVQHSTRVRRALLYYYHHLMPRDAMR